MEVSLDNNKQFAKSSNNWKIKQKKYIFSDVFGLKLEWRLNGGCSGLCPHFILVIWWCAEWVVVSTCTVLWRISKGRRFSEKYWYYLQAQTDMPFHYLKLVVWIFPLFLLLMSVGLAWKSAAKQKETKSNFKNSSLR